MKLRRILPALLALTLALTSCGSGKGYEPPKWLDGFDFAAESARILCDVAESGADDASLAELRLLMDRSAELPYYFFSSAYTGPERTALTEHARTVTRLYEMMLETQNNAWRWSDVAKQTQIYLDTLQATSAPGADICWLPSFERTAESDPFYAVLACFFRAKHASEQKNEIVSVTFGGNTTFGQRADASPALSFNAEFERHSGDLTFPLRLISAYFQNDSLTVLNCDGVLTNATEARGPGALRGSPGYAGIFANGGVEAVNIAGEHTADYFDIGYTDTQENLSAAGVQYFGNQRVLVQEADGVKFGLLGYDLVSNPALALQTLLPGDISAARAQGAQLILVSFHWGEEDGEAPNTAQINAAHLAVDLGADMVVGHHPLGVQGIEVYSGKTIVYSLGSLVNGAETALTGKGLSMLVRQTFQKNEDGTFTPLIPMLLPTLITSAKDGTSAEDGTPTQIGTSNNYTPRPAFGDASDHIVRLVFKYSRPLEFAVKELISVG